MCGFVAYSPGLAIDTLGKNSERLSKSQKEEFVRYRDSKLTLLLKEALGGNCQTYLLATVLPIYYHDTKHTLRFAAHAKRICNRIRPNTNDKHSTIFNLESELHNLHLELEPLLKIHKDCVLQPAIIEEESIHAAATPDLYQMDDQVSKIKLAVRLAPFSDSDEEHARCIVSMGEKEVVLHTPSTSQRLKFSCDFCFNSHWNGRVSNAMPSDFADQATIWQTFSQGIIESTLKGLNSSIVSFGQSGSGKTYSLFSNSPEAPGIAPRLIRDLYAACDKRNEPGVEVTIDLQMFEIYDDKISDLICPDKIAADGFYVRDHPEFGPMLYHNRTIWPPLRASSVNKALEFLDTGLSAAINGADLFKRDRSRIQMFFSLMYTAKKFNGKRELVEARQARVLLAELVGSEHAETSGTPSKSRSLTALSGVIDTLANASLSTQGRTDTTFVNYRSSKTTHLLKDAIGGNSNTVVLATVRPSDADFLKTLSTLEYISRVKTIYNKAKSNVGDMKVLTSSMLSGV
jgi:hypothetical protein